MGESMVKHLMAVVASKDLAPVFDVFNLPDADATVKIFFLDYVTE